MFIYIIPHPSALSSQSETVFYRGIHKKGSDDVVSAVCVHRGRYMYNVYSATDNWDDIIRTISCESPCMLIFDTDHELHLLLFILLIVLLNVHVIFSFFQPSIGPTQLNHIFSRIKTIYCLLIEKEQKMVLALKKEN